MLHALIMAGGGGTRFWPRSRARKPKQFLTLIGDRTLLQQALDRIEAAVPPERTWIITAGDHRGEVVRQLANIPGEQIIGEPCGRDTAACIALGAALIARADTEAVMMVMPADHVIEPMQEFRRALHVAEQTVLSHPMALVTFGIPPTFPSTGYGYIQRGAEMTARQGVRQFKVQAFKEKPKHEVAEQMVASGQYYWNSGLFFWKASTILQALRDHQPKLAAAAEKIAASWSSSQRDKVFQTEYGRIDKISIDFAVMEKSKEVIVIEAPFQWDDVGSWLALERRHPQDAAGNTVLAQHAAIKTSNSIIVGDKETLIATVGVDNLIIIQDGDAILVADKREEGTVKQIVEMLKKQGKERYL
jgi:mannose-1-phosphate guanylyltransferase